MKKLLIGIMSMLLILGCVGCGATPEDKQTDMLSTLNNKYETSFTASDIIAVHEEGNSFVYYFGKKIDIFDETEIFATVYDADNKMFVDNYSACAVEDEIIERATKATGKECFVYVNTAGYPLSANKYDDLNSYINENNGSISFNVYICSDDLEFDEEALKNAYITEFGNTGLVNVEVVDESIYEAIRNKDYETFYGHSNSDKIYTGTIEW